MQVLLEIKDDKAQFVMELLRNFSFVKTTEMSPVKSILRKKGPKSNDVLDNIKTGLEEVKLFKKGKLKTSSAKGLLKTR